MSEESAPGRRGDLTRRSLLGAAAGGAGALALSRVAPALGRSGGPAVFGASAVGAWSRGRRDGRGWLVSGALVAAHEFDLVGVQWQGPAVPVQLRARDRHGRWSRWVPVAPDHGHGPDAPADGRQLSAPVWTGASRALQLRTRSSAPRLALHLIRPTGSAAQAPTGGPLLAGAATARLVGRVLNAGPGQPPIIARAAWAAGLHPSRAPGYAAVKLGFVHHTESANAYGPGESAAMLRSIFHYHRDVRGWHDIGYNFLVDRFGRIFEGRQGGVHEPVVGAQAGGYNLESTGVAVLGSFSSIPVSAAAFDALAHLLAWKLSLHGVPVVGGVTVHVSRAGASYSRYPAGAAVQLKRISGHRDGCSTNCPGNTLYAELPRLRRRAAALAPHRAVLTLAAAAARPGGAATLSGELQMAGAGPIAGATVEIQARRGRREVTLASATTGPDGAWTTTVALAHRSALRGLYRGDASHPAVVSPRVEVHA